MGSIDSKGFSDKKDFPQQIPSAGTSENNGLEIKTPGCFYLQGIGGVLRKRR